MATNAAPEPPKNPSNPNTTVVLSGQGVVVGLERPRKLSEDLALIVREFEVEKVTLREVMAVLHGRGYVVLVMLLALPFATPVPLPGLSTAFGMVIALIGVRLALGQKPWLPARLLDTALSPRFFVKVFAAARTILKGFEFFLKPRLPWLTGSAVLLQIHAVPILIGAVMLLLPLPVPFSNILPAFSIMLISAGLLECDGLFIIAGYLVFICACAFFGLIAFAGVESFELIKRWIFG
jgi:hypothetical protein